MLHSTLVFHIDSKNSCWKLRTSEDFGIRIIKPESTGKRAHHGYSSATKFAAVYVFDEFILINCNHCPRFNGITKSATKMIIGLALMERTSNYDNFRRRIFISKSDLTQFPHNGVITANIVLFTLKFMNKQTSSETGFPLVSQNTSGLVGVCLFKGFYLN